MTSEPDAHDGLPPAPDGGPLTIRLECRPSPGARGPRHDVVIRSDWSLELPHDLEAERVGVALGGYASCLDLVDRSLPAVRAALPLLTRRARAPLHRLIATWAVVGPEATPHCCRREFRSAGAAAEHLRSAAHVAALHGAPEWQLRSLLRSLAAAWLPAEGAPPAAPGADRLVREDGGVAALWRAGLHPRELATLAASATGVTEPLPIRYYLGLAYGSTDPEWLSAVITRRPDPDTAAWLAELRPAETRGDPAEFGAWLGYGLPLGSVLATISAGVPSDEVAAASAATGWAPPLAASQVTAWATAGVHPTPEHYRALAGAGLDRAHPSRRAIDAAETDIAGMLGAEAPDRTELAVMLELLGSRPALLAAVGSGIRSVADLVEAPDLLPYFRPPERTA